MKNLSLLIISLLLMLSCNNATENKVVSVDLANSMNNDQLSEIVTDIRLVPLHSDTIIDRCSNIIVSGDNIFILDKAKNRIVRFDLDGKLINVIERKGRASNEYLEVTDFAVFDNSVFVFDNNGRSIKEYDFVGDFKQSISACTGSNIAMSQSSENRFILYYGRAEDGAISIFDQSGNARANYMPLRKLPSSFSHSKPVTVLDDDVYVNNYFDPTIYNIKESGAIPYISFDFGSKSMSSDILSGDSPMAIMKKIISDKGVKVLDRVVMTNKWITFDAAGTPVYYNANKGVPFVCGDKLKSPFSAMFYQSPYGVTDDGYFYTVISASNFVNAILPVKGDFKFINEIGSRDIKETDNDIMVFFKLK